MGRRRTVVTIQRAWKRGPLPMIRWLLDEDNLAEFLALGYEKVRGASTPLTAEWYEPRQVWAIYAHDWFLGFAKPSTGQFVLNAMDKEIVPLLNGLSSAFERSLYLVNAFGTVWACHSSFWLNPTPIARLALRHQPNLSVTDEDIIREVVEAKDFRLYAYAKLSSERVILINAVIGNRKPEKPEWDGNGSPRDYYLYPREFFEQNDYDWMDKGYLSFPVYVVANRDMYVPRDFSANAMKIVSLQGMQRLRESETWEEFYGVLNSNLLRHLKKDTAMEKWQEMENIAKVSQVLGWRRAHDTLYEMGRVSDTER